MSVLCSPLVQSVVAIKHTTRMFALRFNDIPSTVKMAFVVGIIINYIRDVFLDVEDYITFKEDDVYMIYFPKIVIDNNPIYTTIINDLSVIFKRNKIPIERVNISIDRMPDAKEDGIPELSVGDIEVNYSDIKACEELPPSNHTLFTRADEFYILLLHLQRLVEIDGKPDIIHDNLLYLSSAFYWNEQRTKEQERDELFVDRNKWIAICKELNVNDELAIRHFDNAKRYSYTCITIEEIIKRHSREAREAIEQYRESRIKQRIRTLFNFKINSSTPSDNELWKAFAEYVRKDHFYANGAMYKLRENYCMKIIASQLRGVINNFICYVKEVCLSLKYELIENDKTSDVEALNHRYQKIIQPFENKSSAAFATLAIEQYAQTQIRNEMQTKAIPFQDTVVVYDDNKAYMRKAFMEDQFTSIADVPIMNYGKMPGEMQALSEVRHALKQVFVYKENVHWFIKWCGSLLAHKPERCCLIMYGPKGGNAKTTLANVLLQIFGEWGIQCRPDMLAPNGKSSSCTPFEVELLNKVLAIFSEPQKGVKYSSSGVKELSGADRKKGAAKYKDPIEFQQTAKPVILCNSIPEFDEIDSALIDRLHILKCIGRYMKNATPEDEEHHIYPRDDDFWRNATRIRALAHLIVHEGLPAYIEEGLGKTPMMEEELRIWRKNVCPFTRFLDLTQTTFNSRIVYSSSNQVYASFRRINPQMSLTFTEFIERMKETTGISTIKIKNDSVTYYPFYAPNCSDLFYPSE